jgi:hypothetical protein
MNMRDQMSNQSADTLLSKEANMASSPLVTFADPGYSIPADILLDAGNFNDTKCVVTPCSGAGKSLFAELFGEAVASVTMPKSKALEFAQYATVQRGLSVI